MLFFTFLATVFAFAEAAPALVNSASLSKLARQSGNETIFELAIPRELVARACETGCGITVGGNDETMNCVQSTTSSVGASFTNRNNNIQAGLDFIQTITATGAGFAALTITSSVLKAEGNIEITVSNEFEAGCSVEMNLNSVTFSTTGDIFIAVGPGF